jgi:hypothetical protein
VRSVRASETTPCNNGERGDDFGKHLADCSKYKRFQTESKLGAPAKGLKGPAYMKMV